MQHMTACLCHKSQFTTKNLHVIIDKLKVRHVSQDCELKVTEDWNGISDLVSRNFLITEYFLATDFHMSGNVTQNKI